MRQDLVHIAHIFNIFKKNTAIINCSKYRITYAGRNTHFEIDKMLIYGKKENLFL